MKGLTQEERDAAKPNAAMIRLKKLFKKVPRPKTVRVTIPATRPFHPEEAKKSFSKKK